MTLRKGKLIDDAFGPSIEGPADEIVNDAWDATTPAARVKLARKALSIDINAIDAYNILGLHAQTVAEKIALFGAAVDVGGELFAPLMDDEEMTWWGFMGTRPWMRAQHNLGLAFLEAGDFDNALATFAQLLTINPNDNQGIRYLMLQLFAELGSEENCTKLLELYPEDSSVEFPATRLLLELSRPKPRKTLGKLIEAVQQSNKFVMPMLKLAAEGKWPPEVKADYIARRSKEQAMIYVNQFKQAWLRHPRIFANLLAAER
ncbi:tetratricopeptide repeat protein [Rhizobium sp.]